MNLKLVKPQYYCLLMLYSITTLHRLFVSQVSLFTFGPFSVASNTVSE